jgi:hypothetical protein
MIYFQPDYSRIAIQAAQKLLQVTGHSGKDGPGSRLVSVYIWEQHLWVLSDPGMDLSKLSL